MPDRIHASLAQFVALKADLTRIVHGRWWRWMTLWGFSTTRVVVSYRLSRSLYLLLGPFPHAVLRLALAPVLILLEPWFGRCEIHFQADLGPGLLVLHPSLGLVVSKYVSSGPNLTLTGGNCLGLRGPGRTDISLGQSVLLGANAVILGPVRIGDRVRIGAGAVVTHDANDNAVLVGVPARPIAEGLQESPFQAPPVLAS
jgi:serine acetyltransferase